MKKKIIKREIRPLDFVLTPEQITLLRIYQAVMEKTQTIFTGTDINMKELWNNGTTYK